MSKIRYIDYIVIFVLHMFIPLILITDANIMSYIAFILPAAISTIVIGTITNLLIRSR